MLEIAPPTVALLLLWVPFGISCAHEHHNPVAVAKKAAAYEMNCDEEIYAEQIGDRGSGRGGYVYQVGVKGCGKTDTYAITCVPFGKSCVFDDRSERVKSKEQ